MRYLTAIEDGKQLTLSIEEWCKRRGYTKKLIQQRLRNNYSEEDAINLPKGESPQSSLRRGAGYGRTVDTQLNTKQDRLWLRFITGAYKKQGLAS